MATVERTFGSRHATPRRVGGAGQSVLERIGNTPLLRLSFVGRDFPNVEFLAKAEWFNPGGSVKDRPALSMIQAGLEARELRPGKTITDATSGNTGIAYAMIAAAMGFPVKLCLPDSASHERKRILGALGAELVITPGDEGTDGAIRTVHEIVGADPEKYYYPDQYSNPANWQAHYRTTANEIWQQTNGRITHFVAGLGTSGTFVGTSRRLKEHDPSIKTIAIEPEDSFHGLEGLKHIPTAIVPKVWDPSLADEIWNCPTEPAYDLARAVARTEGLLVGHSSGAALWAVRRLAETVREGVVVTVFPDSGDRYVTDVRRARNIIVERARDRYEIDPRDHIRIQREADAAGLDIVGYYHSHPDHPAQASRFDTERAWAGYVYVIVAVHEGKPVDANAFVAEKDGGPFHPEPLEIV